MTLPTRVSRQSSGIDPFEMMHREFDGVLNRIMGSDGGNGGVSRWTPYGVDVREDADHFYVDAELPGFKKEEIDVTLENQTLTISAERSDSTEQQSQGDYLLQERRCSRFQRSFTLPPTVDESKVDAKLSDGVLHIALDKREETKPRKIQVS